MIFLLIINIVFEIHIYDEILEESNYPQTIETNLKTNSLNQISEASGSKFSKTFGGDDSDGGISIQRTSDGGYIIVGWTRSFGVGGIDEYGNPCSDIWLIKTDNQGNKEWSKTFGGSDMDYGNSVQQTKDGNFVIVGSTRSYGTGSSDIWLLKTDNHGNLLWDKKFGGTEYEEGKMVQLTTDGGYIIIGTTESIKPDNLEIWVIKTDMNGNMQWNRTFGGQDSDWGYYIQQTLDHGYVIIGTTILEEDLYQDVWLLKIDNSGNEQWNRTFGKKMEPDWGVMVQQTLDEGYILIGSTSSYGSGNEDVWVIKVNNSGIEQWNKTYGGKVYEKGHSIQITSDGGYILIGTTESFGAGEFDIWLIKTDPLGIEQWNKTFGGNKKEHGRSLLQTQDGGYIIIGYTISFGTGENDVWLIKTDNFGNSNIPNIDDADTDYFGIYSIIIFIAFVISIVIYIIINRRLKFKS